MTGDVLRRIRRAGGPALIVAGALYLGYHAVQGERGLLGWVRIAERVDTLRAEVAEAHAERSALERRVRLLRPDSLDPDMLEERAADVLNLAPSGTRVLIDVPPR